MMNKKVLPAILIVWFLLFISAPCIRLFSQESSPTEPPAITFPARMVGDVNSDSRVNIIDALMIAQYYVGNDPPGFNPLGGDVNGNGNIDIIDALIVAQYYVGLLLDLP